MNQYAPCPKCRQTNAEKVSFTWWGGIVGPKMLTHVKCPDCGEKYNGKTGKDNTTGIVVYMVVVGVVCFALVFAVVSAALIR
jgi:predicted nucleic-acid-binding Zn-ribbon protein